MTKSNTPSPLGPTEVARAAGVNLQTVRFYEREGLLRPPRRSGAGHRRYDEDAVRVIRFIKRAQSLGFTLEETRKLLALRLERPRRVLAARAAARAKLAEVDEKLDALRATRAELAAILDACICGSGPDACPILDALERP